MIHIKSLGINAEVCKSFFGKTIGFMFSFSKNNAKLFVFGNEKHIDIHMFFVFFPLIAVWLDKDKKIVKIGKMLPFISYSGARAKYVLEIPYSEDVWRKLKRRGRMC
jgi:uncharacterized membrane protein (UPF0127 family)